MINNIGGLLMKSFKEFLKEELEKKPMNKKNANSHIIYHHADSDGRCGGGILRFYCEEVLGSKPIMHPYSHKESTEWLKEIKEGDLVLIVDIALSRDIMEQLNQNNVLVWFDHHKTSIAEMEGLEIEGIRNTNNAGCGLAFSLIKDKINSKAKAGAIRAVELVSDYDNWNKGKYGEEGFKNTPSAFSLYLSSINIAPNNDEGYGRWFELFTKGTMDGMESEEMIEDGRLIMRYQDKKNAGIVKHGAFEITLDGHLGIMCFGVKGSQSFDAVYDESKHDMMIAVEITKDKTYDISLYGTKNIDLSAIAKKYSGGGHLKACGFACKNIDFSTDVLKIIDPI